METERIQELLLAVLPHWNYRIAKPLKQMLDEGISLEMYYCLQTLRWEGSMTMKECARWLRMPKQQMTKLADKMFQMGLVERVSDPKDRRIIKLQVTEKAVEYIELFLKEDISCFRHLLEQMSGEDREQFGQAVETIFLILRKLPSDSEES